MASTMLGENKQEFVNRLNEDGLLFDRSDFDENGNYIAFDAEKNTDYYDKFYGYDKSRSKEAYTEIKEAVESGSVIDTIVATASNIGAAPELIAESFGELAMYMNPYGLTAQIGNYANRNLEERINNKPDLEAQDYAISISAAVAEGLIGKLAIDKLVKVKPIIDKVAKVDPAKATSLTGKIVKRVGATSGAVATESIEEFTQEILQNVGSKLGTDKAGEILSKEGIEEATVAGLLGGIAGGGIRAGVEVVDAIKPEADREKIKGVAADKQKVNEFRKRMEETEEGSQERQDLEREIEEYDAKSQAKAKMTNEEFQEYSDLESEVDNLNKEGLDLVKEMEEATEERKSEINKELDVIREKKKKPQERMREIDGLDTLTFTGEEDTIYDEFSDTNRYFAKQNQEPVLKQEETIEDKPATNETIQELDTEEVTFKPREKNANETSQDIRQDIDRVFKEDGSIDPLLKDTVTKSSVSWASPKGKLKNVIGRMEQYLAKASKDKSKHIGGIVNKDGVIPESIKDTIPTAVLHTYSNLSNEFLEGVGLDRLYNDVGEAIIRSTGLKPEFKENDADNNQRLALTVGIAVVDSMIAAGLFEKETTSIDGNKKVTNIKHNESISAIGKDLYKLSSKLGVNISTRPTFDGEVKPKPEYQPGSSKLIREAINNASQTKFKVNSKLRELFLSLDRQEALEMAGWKDPKTVQANLRESQKRSNEGIERNYDNAIEFIKEAGDKSFTYEYTMWENMRLGMTNTIFNPQRDKQFARALLQIGDEVKVTEKNKTNFFRAVLLAVEGQKIERLSDEQINTLIGEMKEPESYKGSEGLLKLYAYNEYQNYLKSPESFATALHMEVDGVTNGFYYQLLNFPIGNMVEKYGRAVGIFSDKDDSFTNYFGNGGKDIYEFSGEVMKSTAKNIPTYNLLFSENGLMNIRSIMKQPTMNYLYGSGKDAISNLTADTIYEELLSKVTGNNSESQNAFTVLLMLSEPRLSIEQARKRVKDKLSRDGENSLLEFKISQKHEDNIKKNLALTYGNLAYSAVDSNFGDIKKEAGSIATFAGKVSSLFEDVFVNNKFDETLKQIYGGNYKKKKSSLEPKMTTLDGGKVSVYKTEKTIKEEHGQLSSFYHPDTKHPKRVSLKGQSLVTTHARPIVKLNQANDAWTMANNQKSSNGMLSVFDAVITNIQEINKEQETYNKASTSQIDSYSHYKAVIDLYKDAKAKIANLDTIINDGKEKNIPVQELIAYRNRLEIELNRLNKEAQDIEAKDTKLREQRKKIQGYKIQQVSGVNTNTGYVENTLQDYRLPEMAEFNKENVKPYLESVIKHTSGESSKLLDALIGLLDGNKKILIGEQKGKSTFVQDKDAYIFILDPNGSLSDVSHEMIHALTALAFKDVDFRNKYASTLSKIE
jgi:predicted  nucleic acid-binding Zn-ribbon protein